MDPQEKNKYWEIFRGLNPENGYLSGSKAAGVLRSSKLSSDKLEKIWDLADIDDDGMFDFDEFAIAMKITFDLINGVYKTVPDRVPEALVPTSKKHLVAARDALRGNDDIALLHKVPSLDTDPEDAILKDGFDWYISPSDKIRYSDIYSLHCNKHGAVSFNGLAPVFTPFGVPNSQIQKAWKLVNPQGTETIQKDQCLVFLHILTQRSNGFRIPNDVPYSLKASFKRGNIDYNLDSYNSTNNYYSSPTMAPSTGGAKPKSDLDAPRDVRDSDWELISLRNELSKLDEKILSLQRETDDVNIAQNKSKLIQRDLQKVLDYKLGILQSLKNDGPNGPSASAIDNDLKMLEQQLNVLGRHLEGRKSQVAKLEERLRSLS